MRNRRSEHWWHWVPTASGTGCACWRRLHHSSRRRPPHRVPHSAGIRWGGSTGRSLCNTRGGHTPPEDHDTPNPPLAACSPGSRCHQMSTELQEPADRWRRYSRGPHTPPAGRSHTPLLSPRTGFHSEVLPADAPAAAR